MSGNRTSIAAAIFAVATLTPHAQEGRSTGATRPNGAELRVIPIRGNIYMISGAGGNVTASIGKDGVLLVDSGAPPMTDSLLTLAQITRAHPTKDYDPRFGRNPQWTPEMFVGAIYDTLGASGR